MIIKKLMLKVKRVTSESRQFLGKDGVTKVQRQVVNIVGVDSDDDPFVITAFDPSFPLPKEGETWLVPSVKKFECFDGFVQKLLV